MVRFITALLLITAFLSISVCAYGFGLIDIFPNFGSKKVDTTVSLAVIFDASIDTATVTGSNYFVTRVGGADHISGTITFDQFLLPDDTVIFTPDQPWQWGKRYRLNIESGLADLSGGSFAGSLPFDGIFVANIPNDFSYPVFDPTDPPHFVETFNQASVFLGYNPFDPETPADPWEVPGFNATDAWKYSTGHPNVLIAVVDTGILNFCNGEIRKNIFINKGELPLPNQGGAPCADYDCNGDGRFNVVDYELDDRFGGGELCADELIEFFSDGIDDDGNGLVDDICGWDFLRQVNTPLGSNKLPLGIHGYWQSLHIAAEGDNGHGFYVGGCPACMVMPIRTSDGIIHDFSRLASAAKYSSMMGAQVISHAGANFTWTQKGHQDFIDAYTNGTLAAGITSDEMTFHHWMPYAGQDALAVKSIFPFPPTELTGGFDLEEHAFTETWCTGYGSHTALTVPAGTYCTSESIATIGGAFGLLYSYAESLGIELAADEAKQLMTMTAYDIRDHCYNVIHFDSDCQPGFDARYGYGRVDLGRALAALGDPDIGIDHSIPPVVRIISPQWWFTNKLEGEMTQVEGQISARVYPMNWIVQIAKGHQPLDHEFVDVDSGTATSAVDGLITSFDPANYIDDQWASRPVEGPFTYDVTLRVQASYLDANNEPVIGEARINFSAHKDNDPETGLVNHFPLWLEASGESSPILYDLDGDSDRRLEIILGTADGMVHALKYFEPGDAWGEYPGFPVDVSGDDPWYTEAVFASLAVADLFGDSTPEIVAATTGGKVYAIDPESAAKGDPLLPGFPVSADPPDNTSVDSFAQGNGFMSSPVLADLDLDGVIEIIAGSLDQKIYAWKPAKKPGTAQRLSGWPVLCRSEQGLVPDDKICGGAFPPGVILGTPAVGILDPDHSDPAISRYPTVLVPTNEDCAGETIGSSRLYAVYHDGMDHPGGPFLPDWPAAPSDVMDQIPFFNIIGGLSGSPAVYVGEEETKIAIGTTAFLPQIIRYKNGDYQIDEITRALSISASGSPALSELVPGQGLSFILPSIGLLHWQGDHLKLAKTKVMAYTLDRPYRKVFDGTTDDVPMLLSTAAADIDNDGNREVISGSGDHLVHAHKIDGSQAEGWPKYTQKWTWATPAVGDMDADGKIEIISHTREGYLYAWETPGHSCPEGKPNSDWRRFSHDERNTGYYRADTVPSGRVTDLEVVDTGRDVFLITFTAPGDDWWCGQALSYEFRYTDNDSADLGDWEGFNSAELLEHPFPTYPAGEKVTLYLKKKKAFEVAMIAKDDAGNISRISNVAGVRVLQYDVDDDDSPDDDDFADDDDSVNPEAESDKNENSGCCG